MTIAFAKPYLPVADQLSLLKARGMTISDETKATAYLEKIGYYRLSGYWYPWRESTLATSASPPRRIVYDQFRPGVEFRHVINLYVFDKKLRLLMLDGIERIEVALRTEIGLLLGRISPTAHRDAACLSRRFAIVTKRNSTTTEHAEWLQRLDRAFQSSREDFVKHYKTTYSSPLPLWAAIELWDFGMLSHFLSGMRDSDLDTLAAKYGLPRRVLLTSWVRSINFVRNLCAHHCRLWNRAMIDQPRPSPLGMIPQLDHLTGDTYAQERLYGVAAVIRYFLRTINPGTTWGVRLRELMDSFPSVSGISIRHMGFPSNWQQHPLWS